MSNARHSLFEFLELEPPLGRSDAAKILEILAEKCLEEYDFDRNEAALCFITSILANLAPLWTKPEEEDDLASVGAQIYGWLIEKTLGKDAASPRLKLSIASLLDAAAHLQPSVVGESLPSPRTSLLGLLRESSNFIRFRLSPLLVRLFNRYVLTEHEIIFDDIVENLPSDLDNFEGVAVRFFLLSELGARWSTILRHVSYHLFETAATVPKMQLCGQYSVRTMSNALELKVSAQAFQSVCATSHVHVVEQRLPSLTCRTRSLDTNLSLILSRRTNQKSWRKLHCAAEELMPSNLFPSKASAGAKLLESTLLKQKHIAWHPRSVFPRVIDYIPTPRQYSGSRFGSEVYADGLRVPCTCYRRQTSLCLTR